MGSPHVLLANMSTKRRFNIFVIDTYIHHTDTPTAKARWVLIYIHFQIYSKAYKTNELL